MKVYVTLFSKLFENFFAVTTHVFGKAFCCVVCACVLSADNLLLIEALENAFACDCFHVWVPFSLLVIKPNTNIT